MFIFPGTSGCSCGNIPCSTQAWIVSNADEACGSPGRNSRSRESAASSVGQKGDYLGKYSHKLAKMNFY